MNCPNCGGSVPPGVNRCNKCGSFIEQAAPQQAPLQAPMAPVMAPAGAPAPAVPAGPPKSKIAAGLLGIFLGAFGVHNFYLGNIGIAVVQLLLTVFGISTICCTFGITWIIASIWGLIEGILILVGTINRDAEGRPLV